MSHIRIFVSAMASLAASVAFQIGLATGHFKSFEWAITPLFSVSGALCLSWLILWLVERKKTEQQALPVQPPINAENKAEISPNISPNISPTFSPQFNPTIEQHVHVGGRDATAEAISNTRSRHEEIVIAFLKEHVPANQGRDYEEIAKGVNLSKRDTRDALERLEIQGRVWSTGLIEAAGGKAYFLDDVER
jgi:hypothetical protein